MKRPMTLLAMVLAALAWTLSASPAASADELAIAEAERQGFHIVLESDVSAQAFADCPSGYGCFWIGLNGIGSRWDAPWCGVWSFEYLWLDDNVESVRNRGGGTIHLYDAHDSTNGYMRSVVNNGEGVNLESGHRNRAGSIRIDC
jgi:hypothetical protein